MSTYSGRAFWPMDPRESEIDIVDIGRALSKICRFGGHCREFYSVAQHCCHVSDLCTRSIESRKWGLLHDAAEAYIGDMVRPLKQHMPNFREVELKILIQVAMKFDLPAIIPDQVRRKDEALLHTEALALLPETLANTWASAACAVNMPIVPWDSAQAYKEFMDRYSKLWSVKR